MSIQADAPQQTAPASGPTAAPGQASGDQLATALREAPGSERVRLQAEVYASRNGISLSQALSALPLEARLEIMKGQWEAAQSFFASWAKSIEENGAADRQASKLSLENSQRVALQERNGAETRRVLNANSAPVERRTDGLLPPGRFGVQVG